MDFKEYSKALHNIGLFKNFSDEDFSQLFKNIDYKIIDYSKDSLVLLEGEECNTLNIILKGNLRIQKIDSFGKALVIAEFKESDIVGETLLFGEPNFYPMSGISIVKTTILYIPKSAVLYLCKNDDIFLVEFLKLISGKSITLSTKLSLISLKTIRQKICEFILLEYKNNNSLKVKLNMTKKEWADIIGVQRPSLSRELLRMKEIGLIDYDYNYIFIKNLNEIKNVISQAVSSH